MSKLAAAVLIFCVMGFSVAADPATKPADAKNAKPPPKQKFTLMHGAVRYLIPDGWNELERADNDAGAQYQSPDGQTTLTIKVVPQEYPMPTRNLAFREKMKAVILKGMKQSFEDRGLEVLYGPKSETDDRFLLRVHDRIKDGDGALDEVNLYLAIGLDLVNVATFTKAEDPAEIKKNHTVGEETLLGTVLGLPNMKKAPAK